MVDDEIVARDTEQRIADVPLLDGIDPTEWHANAHLIAAAPELLAALKDVIDTLQREAPGTPLNNHRFDALGIQAHKAIAKAEAR